MSNKRRLTITVNGMPDELADKLQELGDNRKLTPYIVGLIEKEEKMDKLINGLSSIVDQMNSVSNKIDSSIKDISHIKEVLNNNEIPIHSNLRSTSNDTEIVQQGKLNISDNIQGGIEEEIKDTYDF